MESEFQQITQSSSSIRNNFGDDNSVDCRKEEIKKNYGIKSECRVVLKRLNIKVKSEDCKEVVDLPDEYEHLKLMEKNKSVISENRFNRNGTKIEMKEKEQSEEHDTHHNPKRAKQNKYNIDRKRFSFSIRKFNKIQRNIKKKYFKVMFTSLSKQEFTCNLCTQTFTNYKVLRAHLLFHIGKKPFHCTTCNQKFLWEFILQRHKKEHKNEIQIEINNREFDLQSSSKYLLEPVEQWKPFECDICGKRVMSLSRLEMHHKTHSSYICKICKKEFKWESYLRLHMLTHSEDRPFKCDICNKGFKTKYSWLKHNVVHGDKSDCCCEICKTTFKTQQLLSIHMEKHRKYDYSCDICNRPFKTNSSLCNHRATHRGKLKYFCEM